VVRAREYRTPVKTRILAGGVHAARQQVVRIDRDTGWPLDESVSRTLARKIEPALDGCDAVLLSVGGSAPAAGRGRAAVARHAAAADPSCSTRATA
jgi:bifunctional ADP-heptose synthase (sugar kinase/adenylyltransferase)